MKKTIIVSSIVILLSAGWTIAAQPQGQPFAALEDAISSIQNQINNIQLLPGPKGDKGDTGERGLQGPAGTPSWDEARISALETRVAALENPVQSIVMPGTRLWTNYHPTTDKTEGQFIDVSSSSGAILHFDWQGGSGHACQYSYLTSNDGINIINDSTFLYFTGNVCQATADIPVNTNFIRIDAWTPPSGTLNASLELVRKSVVQDNFNSYSDGSIIGQGGWFDRQNGSTYLVQGSIVNEGTKSLHQASAGDNLITKTGTSLADGIQSVFVRTENRANWGNYGTGENFQVRLSNGGWDGPFRIDVAFFKNGSVAYNGTVVPWVNFGTYNDNTWNLLDIEWRSIDKTARYRINNGPWTAWDTFNGAASFTSVDNIGFDSTAMGSGGVYIDDLH